jgi:hypothetical protein
MFRRFLSYLTSAALVLGTIPAPLGAQPAPAPAPAPVAAAEQGQNFSAAQLDALLAPIALYPDALLTLRCFKVLPRGSQSEAMA